MSDRRSPQAQSSRLVEPPLGPPAGAAAVWHGSVNGHAQAVVVIAVTGSRKPSQS